jgi:hypothetical protein
MSGARLLMMTIGVVAIVGGGVILLRPARSEAGVYGRRIGGMMLVAFGLVLLIAAVSLGSALGVMIDA